MCRFSIVLISSILISNFAHAAETQNWECAINLHQGDQGTLSLQRKGDNVNGAITVSRNDSTFKSEVSGKWSGNEINIKRLLDANSNEPMAGIVVAIGTQKINIGGRYSDSYKGVWSADCDLVSASGDVAGESASGGASSVKPSTSSRVTPSRPTNKDRIKFSAIASHPDGIKSVSFFLGEKKIHTCDGKECKLSYGPLSKGSYAWSVEAVSNSDAKSAQTDNLVVVAGDKKGQCKISGLATGTVAELSTIYVVNLFGPDNDAQFRATTGFANGSYSFANLPQGNYLLTVDTRADEAVLATPSSTKVNCKASGNVTQNFDFR